MAVPNPEISTYKYYGSETTKDSDLVGTELREIENINTLLNELLNGTSTVDTVVHGLLVTPQSGMTVSISVGLAFCQSTVELAHNYVAATLTMPTSGSAVVYTIEIQQTPTDFNTQNRAYLDPVAGGVTYQPIPIQKRYQATVQYKAGGSTTAATKDAGWVKIAEITIPGSSSSVTAGMIKNVSAGYAGESNTGWTAETTATFLVKSIDDNKALFRVQHTEVGAHGSAVIEAVSLDVGTSVGQVNADLLPLASAIDTLGLTSAGTIAVGTKINTALQALASTTGALLYSSAGTETIVPFQYGTYVVLNAPKTINLPAATGSKYRFRIIHAVTGGPTTVKIVPNGTDKLGAGGNVACYLHNSGYADLHSIELIDLYAGYWAVLSGQYVPDTLVGTEASTNYLYLGGLVHLPGNFSGAMQVGVVPASVGAYSSIPMNGYIPSGCAGVLLGVQLTTQSAAAGQVIIDVAFSNYNNYVPDQSFNNTPTPHVWLQGYAPSAGISIVHKAEIIVPLQQFASTAYFYMYSMILTNINGGATGAIVTFNGFYTGF
jgi:hypothetical protein